MVSPARDHAVWLAAGPYKQDAYGYANLLADGNISSVYPIKRPPDYPKIESVQMSDLDECGRATEWATQTGQKIELFKSSLPIKCYATSEALGLLGSMAFGSCSSAQQGGTSAYKHTLSPADYVTVEGQLPSTSMILAAYGYQIALSSLIPNSIEVSGEVGKRLELACELVGDGYHESNVKVKPSAAAKHYLRMLNASFALGVSGSEVAEAANVLKFSHKFSNGLLIDQGYTPGCGQYAAEMLIGERKFETSLTLRRKEATYFVAHTSGSLHKLTISAVGELADTGYYHTLTIVCGQVKYRTVGRGNQDGVETIELALEHFADSTYPVYWEVTNLDTAYLQAEP